MDKHLFHANAELDIKMSLRAGATSHIFDMLMIISTSGVGPYGVRSFCFSMMSSSTLVEFEQDFRA